MINDNPKLQMALNSALEARRLAQSRMAAANPNMAGAGIAMDGKRSHVWCEYGWKEKLEFQDFHNAFVRGGVAHGAVKKIRQRCWRTNPWVIEGEPRDNATAERPWEKKFKAIMKPVKMWRAWSTADLMRLVSGWSGLVLHIRDGQNWDQPASPGRGIEKLTPVWGVALQPRDFVTDEANPRFGLPEFWEYSVKGSASTDVKKVKLHWTRLFVIGDWRGEMPRFLEPAFNSLTNLEKVEGGSGESFLKNAARQLNINFDMEAPLQQIADAHGVKLSELQQVYDQVTRGMNQGVDATVLTQGATVTPLVSAVSDPSPTYNINIQTIGAALDIPSKILVGNQTGERASTEDNEYFDERCQSRREDELSPELEEWVEHLIALGLIKLPAKGFTVMWDDLTESSPTGKLTLAKTMADMNASSMGEPYFTTDEVREAGGYEAGGAPLPDDDEEEEDDDSDPKKDEEEDETKPPKQPAQDDE